MSKITEVLYKTFSFFGLSFEQSTQLLQKGRLFVVRRVSRLINFCQLIFRICWERDIFSLAQALSYTTVLSLVPITVIFFFVLGRITENEQRLYEIVDFISGYLLPEYISSLLDLLTNLSNKALNLGLIGFPSLLVVGVFLFMKVDLSINRLWLSLNRRGIFHSLSAFVYSAVIGPILLVAVLSLPSYLKFLSANDISSVSGWFNVSFLSVIAPFFLSFFLFCLMYVFIPTEKVRLASAMFGAFWTSILLRLINSAVEIYLQAFSKFDLLYGSITFLPVVMLWLYMVWLLILFGSVLVYAHQTTSHKSFTMISNRHAHESSFYLGLHLLLYLVYRFKSRKEHPDFVELCHVLQLEKVELNNILHPLLQQKIVHYSRSKSNNKALIERIALSCDPANITMQEIVQIYTTQKKQMDGYGKIERFLQQIKLHPFFRKQQLTLADVFAQTEQQQHDETQQAWSEAEAFFANPT